MFKFTNLVKVYLIYLFSSALGQTQNTSCTTPDNRFGSCIDIKACNYLLNLLRNRAKTKEQTEFLKASRCNLDKFDSKNPAVCCPLDVVLPTKKVCGITSRFYLPGDTVASLDEHPWMAILEYKRDNYTQFLCDGVLISKRYVLTAAHCITRSNQTDRKPNAVRLGEHTLSKNLDCIDFGGGLECIDPPITVPVEEVVIHEKYKSADMFQHNDIALLRLKINVEFSDFIKPICLPIAEAEVNKNYTGHTLALSGWGITENNTHSDSKFKLKATVWNNEDCVRRYLGTGRNVESTQHLCAAQVRAKLEGRDSCKGYSGSPLLSYSSFDDGYNWYVIGLDSFGAGTCDIKGWPEVYTRVATYNQWILSNIRS